MNIIEVKNNYVKLCYEGELSLSEFVLISDNNKSYLAQVLYLEASRMGKTAVAGLLFNYGECGISAYDGSIPSLRAKIEPADTSIMLETLEKKDPLKLGNLAQQNGDITVDYEVLKDRPIIITEKYYTSKVLLSNIAMQIQARKHKLVVFDTAGIFKTNKLTITKDFKLPLNNSTINYIYGEEFKDSTAESKAMIQSIFEELAEYSKTVEFIPFDTFQAVIASEVMRTKLIQLVILKNKINQLRDKNIFAQDSSEFNILKTKFETENTVVIDISCLNDSLQKECIKYVYTILNGINSEFFVFTPLTNENSDKFLLKQIFDTGNTYTTAICGYDYRYLPELKKCSKNMLMFTPLKQQNDFGRYNIFLQKLAENEFIAYGKMTKFVPLIAELYPFGASDLPVLKIPQITPQIAPQKPVIQTNTVSESAKENIKTETNEITEEFDAKPDVIIETPQEQVKGQAEFPEIAASQEVSVPEIEDRDVIISEQAAEPLETEDNAQDSFTVPDGAVGVSQESVPEIIETGEIVSEQIAETVKTDAVSEVQSEVIAEPVSEQIAEPAEINETVQEPVIESVEAEEVQEVQPEDIVKAGMPEQIIEEPVQEQSSEAAELNEVQEPAVQEISEPDEIKPEQAAEPAAAAQEVVQEEAEQSVEAADVHEESAQEQDAAQKAQNEVQTALDDAPDIQDEDELSDDDLDMIEKLSKPDEDIPIINQADKQKIKPENPSVQPVETTPAKIPQEQNQPPQNSVLREQKSVKEEIQNAKIPMPQSQPLQTRKGATPVVPEFPSDIPDEDKVHSDKLQAGDKVFHQEFGEGVVEKMINYGNKLLCSVNFPSVGRRLLNPEISEMKKI